MDGLGVDGLSEKVYYLTEIVGFLNKENAKLKRGRCEEIMEVLKGDNVMRITKARKNGYDSQKTASNLLIDDVHHVLCTPKLIDISVIHSTKMGRKSLLSSRNRVQSLEIGILLERSRLIQDLNAIQ